jgi:ketosteroid isomerase-like protein
MSALENKNIVQAFYDASNRGDLEACFELLADDIVWTNIGSTTLSGRYEGKQDLSERLLGPLFGNLKAGISTRVHRLIAEGDHVVAQTSGTAETLDGRPYDNSYCWVIRLRDGRFAEVTEYMDTDLLRRVFG